MLKPLVINRADGTSRAVVGYRPRKPAGHLPKFKSTSVTTLPPRVDLREYMTDVEDQGPVGSCVANATAGAYEYLVKRHKGDAAYDVSRLFIYYNARALEGGDVSDSGAEICKAIEGLKQFGACAEKSWPYAVTAVNDKPEDTAFEEASQFLVEHVQVVPVELDAWKGALAEGHPIIFGIRTFESFDKQAKPGLIPTPSENEAKRATHGGHSMLAVGYSDKDRVFIVRNSWGTAWGDEGYCYIPYDYLMNPKYNDGDTWIIQRLEKFEVDESTWTDDANSLLPDLAHELASMTPEEHQSLLDDLGEGHLEARVAVLFLEAGSGDAANKVTVAAFTKILAALGSNLDPSRVLTACVQITKHKENIKETIEIFGKHFSAEFLAQLSGELTAIAKAEGKDQSWFIDSVISAWQVGEGDEEVSDEDSEEEEDSDEEDDDSEEESDDEEDDDSEEESDDEEDDDSEEASDEEATEEAVAPKKLVPKKPKIRKA